MMAGNVYEAFSAGTKPSHVRPEAIAAMGEIGIDISGHRSKSVDEFAGQAFDYVITVCDNARESCPVFPAATKRIHWSLDDPAALQGSEEQRWRNSAACATNSDLSCTSSRKSNRRVDVFGKSFSRQPVNWGGKDRRGDPGGRSGQAQGLPLRALESNFHDSNRRSRIEHDVFPLIWTVVTVFRPPRGLPLPAVTLSTPSATVHAFSPPGCRIQHSI